MQPLSHYGCDRASRPPPLLHRVPIRAALTAVKRQLLSVGIIRIAPGPFQSQAERLLGRERLGSRPLEPRGTWTYV
jgi:hypothetical protein